MRLYFDHNATTPVAPDVRAAMTEALDLTGNPSSIHADGRAARQLVETARRQVADMVNVSPDTVTFTSGGTEANTLACHGLIEKYGITRILAAKIEHPSLLDHITHFEDTGGTVRWLTTLPDGRVDAAEATAILNDGSDHPTLVCVMLANNETGVLQDVAAVANAAKQHGARVLCDAAQVAGRMPLTFADLNVDVLTISAHKFGGPKGAGAVVRAPGTDLTPMLHGGGQEMRLRPGTENVAAIAGFGKAAQLAPEAYTGWSALADLRDALEDAVSAHAPGVKIFGKQAARLPNTSCFALPGLSAEQQVIALDLDGISVSAGSACSSGKVTPSEALLAMGATEQEAASAIRVSLGPGTDPSTSRADIDRFVAAWSKIAARATPHELQKSA